LLCMAPRRRHGVLLRKNRRSPMREVIAKRIIETAQQGVKDRLTLVDDAVRFLAADYRDVGKQPA
jgi:hypothetical protein